jgi:hypothetical protein
MDSTKHYKFIAQKIEARAANHARECSEPSRADLRAMLEEAVRNTAKMQKQDEVQQ